MSSYIEAWLLAFGLTVAVELAVATPLLAPTGAGWARRAGVVLLANMASHPVVWFVFPATALAETKRLLFSETWAFAVEATSYALVWPTIGGRRAVAVSTLANGASLGFGLALRALGVSI